MNVKVGKRTSFAALFKELDAIVAECENGDIDLEKSMPKFRRGLEMARDLQKRLKIFENEIVEIKKEFSDIYDTTKSSDLFVKDEQE